MAFKMSGFSGFTKQIDDKDIANIAKEKGLSVSMVNNILKEISMGDPGADIDVVPALNYGEASKAVDKFLKGGYEGQGVNEPD